MKLIGILLLAGGMCSGSVCAKKADLKSPAKKKTAKLSSKRTIASVSPVEIDTMVYDEQTSFEAMLAKKEQLSRKPSAFDVKARVIGIRRDLGLTNESDRSAPRDVVLNAGSNAGISEGMVLAVKRNIPILDPYRENTQRQLEIVFAKIRIVHVQDELSIARISSVEDVSSGIAIGTRSVLIGDYVGAN